MGHTFVWGLLIWVGLALTFESGMSCLMATVVLLILPCLFLLLLFGCMFVGQLVVMNNNA